MRDRLREPPPHVLEHADHSDHSLAAQSWGQLNVWQAVIFVRAPHSLPQELPAVTIARVCVITPLPHDREHAASCQSDAKQSRAMHSQLVPSATEWWSAGQVLHSRVPVKSAKAPLAHVRQLDAAWTAAYLPVAQREHEDAPAFGLKRPAWQSVQWAEPAALDRPAAQVWQLIVAGVRLAVRL